MYRLKLLILLVSFFSICSLFVYKASAQERFVDKCLGKWEGMMYLYGKGKLRDSVLVQLVVEKTTKPNTWTWKTIYLSKTHPMEKDYKLVLKNEADQLYITDEGGGIELTNYGFENKLYSTFETHDVMLTSSYEIKDSQLIFEVTSGKKIAGNNEVVNYSVLNLQRVVYKKIL